MIIQNALKILIFLAAYWCSIIIGVIFVVIVNMALLNVVLYLSPVLNVMHACS